MPRRKSAHPKPKKPRLSRLARSFINRENLVNSPAARAKAGWGLRRRAEMKGVPKKLLTVYTPDYVVFHKWCLLAKKPTKLDAMHDLIAPLYAEVQRLEAQNA